MADSENQARIEGNLKRFIAFRLLYSARFYYPVFTVLFLSPACQMVTLPSAVQAFEAVDPARPDLLPLKSPESESPVAPIS